MKIFPQEIAQAIVNSGNFSDEQSALIVIAVLIAYIVIITLFSGVILACGYFVKNFSKNKNNSLHNFPLH